MDRCQAARRPLFMVVLFVAALAGCGVNGTKKTYVLAEKLWADGKYAAAVTEFEKVSAKDPQGKLGQQALLRSAMTEAFFLSRYSEAIRKLNTYVDRERDQAGVWDAQKLVGEIFYTKTEQYDQVIQHYKGLILKRPDAVEVPEFQFRIAKSHFFLTRFDDALRTFQDLIKKHPTSPWAERAAYEIGVTYFTRGEQHPNGRSPGMESYQEAMDSFQAFLKRYPKSDLAAQAQFGIAGCLEEMDQLDAAYHTYESLRKTYPSPKVIEIKLARIQERKAQRNR